MKKCLVDSGPLYALFDKDDKYHEIAKGTISKKRFILCTTWPVLTEVAHLLSFNVQSQIGFMQWVERGALQIFDIRSSDIKRIIELSIKYSDLPMDLADASLVTISERESIKTIFSFDSDFSIYRYRKGSFTNIYRPQQ